MGTLRDSVGRKAYVEEGRRNKNERMRKRTDRPFVTARHTT